MSIWNENKKGTERGIVLEPQLNRVLDECFHLPIINESNSIQQLKVFA